MPDSSELSTGSLLKLQKFLCHEPLYDHSSIDQEEQGLELLLQCTQDLLKKHLIKCTAIREELKAVKEELGKKQQEISALNSEAARKKLKCCNCAMVEKELDEVKREAREAQSRMDSIAKILRISEKLSQNDRNQTAYDLVSQYVGKGLQEDVENIPNRKKFSPTGKKEVGFRLASDVPQECKANSPAEKREVLVPKLVDSQEMNSMSEKQLTPNKGRVKFNINSSSEDSNELLDDTIKEYIKRNEAELNRLWGGDVEKKETPDPPVAPARSSTWSLKDSKGPKEIDKASGKAFKQTKLGFKNLQKRLDVSKLDGFNGGVPSQQISSSSTKTVQMEVDDDIILASPEAASSGGGYEDLCEALLPNITDFKPAATSTQAGPSDEGSRTDRSKKQKLDSKNQFVYQRGPVRKKEDRAKLSGWSCFQCEKYYTSLGLTAEELQKRMNACSKHRDNHDPKLDETPAGYWNPLFPNTPERERLYPAVFGKKDKK